MKDFSERFHSFFGCLTRFSFTFAPEVGARLAEIDPLVHALRLTPVLRQTVAVLISYRRRYFECFSYHCFKNGDWLRTAPVLSC